MRTPGPRGPVIHKILEVGPGSAFHQSGEYNDPNLQVGLAAVGPFVTGHEDYRATMLRNYNDLYDYTAGEVTGDLTAHFDSVGAVQVPQVTYSNSYDDDGH